MKYFPKDKQWRTKKGNLRVSFNGKVTTIDECKKYMESCGWSFQHRDIFGNYIFRNETRVVGQKELAFTLRELREARVYGF